MNTSLESLPSVETEEERLLAVLEGTSYEKMARALQGLGVTPDALRSVLDRIETQSSYSISEVPTPVEEESNGAAPAASEAAATKSPVEKLANTHETAPDYPKFVQSTRIYNMEGVSDEDRSQWESLYAITNVCMLSEAYAGSDVPELASELLTQLGALKTALDTYRNVDEDTEKEISMFYLENLLKETSVSLCALMNTVLATTIAAESMMDNFKGFVELFNRYLRAAESPFVFSNPPQIGTQVRGGRDIETPNQDKYVGMVHEGMVQGVLSFGVEKSEGGARTARPMVKSSGKFTFEGLYEGYGTGGFQFGAQKLDKDFEQKAETSLVETLKKERDPGQEAGWSDFIDTMVARTESEDEKVGQLAKEFLSLFLAIDAIFPKMDSRPDASRKLTFDVGTGGTTGNFLRFAQYLGAVAIRLEKESERYAAEKGESYAGGTWSEAVQGICNRLNDHWKNTNAYSLFVPQPGNKFDSVTMVRRGGPSVPEGAPIRPVSFGIHKEGNKGRPVRQAEVVSV